MPILASNFTSNSLQGTVVVDNGWANVNLQVDSFALEGNKSFVIKLRKDNFSGTVLSTSNTINIFDYTGIVSLTANTATVNEGNLIGFTLTTVNVVNYTNVFYSVLPVTANVTSSDFIANTGMVTIFNNVGTFALQANADLTLVDETGENFKVQIRTNSPTGNNVYETSNISIVDFYKSYRFNSLTATNNNTLNGSNVFFRLNTTNANGLILYYSTANVSGTENLFPSNTGSVLVTDEKNETIITLASNVCIPIDEFRTFQLQVRSGSATGPILITSNNVTMSGYSSDNFAVGGTLVEGDGYRYHVFTTSGILEVQKIGFIRPNVQYLVAAGGGGAGTGTTTYPGGGGAGGFLEGNITFNSLGLGNISVQVGGGGSGSTSPGTNTFIGSSLIAVGGGGSGPGAPPGGTNVYPGGSGGGLGLFQPTAIFSSNVIGQGYPGGPGGGFPARQIAGGGGGAGQAGFNNPGTVNTMGVNSGGNGLPITWLTYSYFDSFGAKGFGNVKYFAGGGGGGSSTTTSSAPGGFGGGGGNKAEPSPAPGIAFRLAGNVNTGGGAGGAYGAPIGSGGSGIVIIRYPYTSYNLLIPAGAVAGTNVNVIANIFITPSPQTLFWSTTGGNATPSDFVSNTGSWLQYNGNTSFTIGLTNNVLGSNTKTFQLQIRTGSNTGVVVYSSNIITIYGPNANTQIMATGGNLSTITDNGKTYLMHAFTTSNTFTISKNPLSLPIEYIAIGGGGQGGNRLYGGGGGAGGFLQGNLVYGQTETSYIITVGAGGSGNGSGTSTRGANGNPTLITSTYNLANIVAFGGGGGGSGPEPGNSTGNPGASGGGSSTYNSTAPAPGIPGQGNPGGVAAPSFGGTGGGGGAGVAGGNGTPAQGGNGGNGLPVVWVTTSYGTPGPTPGRWFAGGGGGDGSVGGNPGGVGGIGGGRAGAGPATPNPSALAANVNTGGGGGGSSPTNASQGGVGGSGIVILRYLYPSTQ